MRTYEAVIERLKTLPTIIAEIDDFWTKIMANPL